MTQPSALPSTPTSPTSLRPTATRARIKPLRQGPIGNVSSTLRSKPHAERTRSMSPSLPETVTPDLITFGSEFRTIAPAGASVVTSKRRQSSIAYYTPSSPSPWNQRPQLNRTHSSDGPREVFGPVVADTRQNVSRRSSLVLSSRSHSTRESLASMDPSPRERVPLTLVEKHADLLHFIAQKERKCLELRDQLTTHEKELAELKRKWERIVNVNGGHDPLPNPPLTAGIGGVTLDGLKEGVRMIAAGFSDLGGVIHELESGDKDSSKCDAQTHVHKAHENDASKSSTTQIGSEQLSASPVSSIQQHVHTSDRVLDGGEEDTITVAAVSSLSRAGSLDTRMHKRSLRVIAKESVQTSSSLSPPTQGPKSGDLNVGMSLVLGPSPTLVPPMRSVFDSTAPGPAISSTHKAGPVSSWMDSMGKKLNELQNGQTFSKSQKRASVLLAGVSSTISSALLPGPTATTPAPMPTSTPRTKLSLMTTRPLSPRSPPHNQPNSQVLPTYRTMTDWLDDDDEDQAIQPERLLPPESNPPSCSAAGRSTVGDKDNADATPPPPAVSSFDDDDWNW